MAIKCFSLGAAQEVTGSKHIFQIDDRMFMVDCGAFQGKRKESDQKNRNFQIDTERLESGIQETFMPPQQPAILPTL